MRHHWIFQTLISHELRSPLNAILGWTRILRRSRRDDQLYDRGHEVIERSARMQSQLVEDLLDTARAISGKLKLEVRPTDVADVIEKAEEIVRPAAEVKGVSLDTRLDRNVGQITGDPDRLQQVVWNLLSNAVKFTDEGGRVEVSLERIDHYVQITVRDTGQGIKPEFLPYGVHPVFESIATAVRRRRVVDQHHKAADRVFGERNEVTRLRLVANVGAKKQGTLPCQTIDSISLINRSISNRRRSRFIPQSASCAPFATRPCRR